MGLGYPVLTAIAREAAYRPFFGKALTLGRQTIELPVAQASSFLEAHGVKTAAIDLRQDTVTSQFRRDGLDRIIDIDFLRLLGFSEVNALDVSGFEGAEIVHDLNQPISNNLENAFDFLIDGSTLDNIFNPTCGLQNIAKLVKPGGRCLISNMGNYSSGFPGIPYTMFNPLWFWDYFIENNWKYCQVNCVITRPDGHRAVYLLAPEATANRWAGGIIKPICSKYVIGIVVFAEKGTDSTWDKMPTQHAYRRPEDWRIFSERAARYAAIDRPPLITGDSGQEFTASTGWIRVGPKGLEKG